MDRPRLGTRLAILGLLLASGCLVYLRGGLLAWTGLAAALLLLAKHARRPARSDALAALGFTLCWLAAWAAAWSYVRSTWESGEVVELGVRVGDATHVARVWVLDVEGEAVMYYDAPPDVGRALMAGAPITLTRGGLQSAGCANAVPVDALPEAELAGLLSEMQAKYRERNRATDVFYVVIGVERDRVGLVVRIGDCA